MTMTDAGPLPGDSGPPPSDTGPRDAGPPGNNSFETAGTVTLGTPLNERIERAGDVDFFRFEGTAGQWIQILASAPAESDPRADTVVTLFDSAMMQIAENDDAQPRSDTDSEIIVRLPSAGTYYVRVQEYSSWITDDMVEPAGGASYGYELTVGEIPSTATQVLIEPATDFGDDAASATAIRFASVTGGRFGLVLGGFDSGTDVDVLSFTVAAMADAPHNFDVIVMPEGNTGYGSTNGPGRVWITNADGTEIIARATIGEAVTGVNPSLAAGDLLLFVEASGAGSNDHYVVKVFDANEDNPVETAELTNGSFATAEPLTMEAIPADEGVTGERVFIGPRLGADDVDYFSFSVMAGREVSISCGSRTSGSGVVGLVAELRDGTEAVLGTSTETATENAFIDAVAVPAAGTYYLRITKASQDAAVTGDWVRCGIRALAPMP